MSEIADFLRARYAERRALALAAKPGPWHSDGGSVYAAHPTDEVVDYTESADHIAANDPTSVIADLDAKLALVEEAEQCEAAVGKPDRDGGDADAMQWVLYVLARPFTGHPDHKGEEWAP